MDTGVKVYESYFVFSNARDYGDVTAENRALASDAVARARGFKDSDEMRIKTGEKLAAVTNNRVNSF